MAMASGVVPTAIDVVTEFEDVLITETVPDP
jgi:hypothetical protein